MEGKTGVVSVNSSERAHFLLDRGDTFSHIVVDASIINPEEPSKTWFSVIRALHEKLGSARFIATYGNKEEGGRKGLSTWNLSEYRVSLSKIPREKILEKLREAVAEPVAASPAEP